MKRLTTFILILWACLGLEAQNDSLVWRLDSLLQDPMFETTQVGLLVYDLTTDSVVYGRNARQHMRPASTMKLVTSITALDLLGGDYEYKTRIRYTGTISGRTLRGNIYCVGGFDPSLTADDIAVMAESVKNLGIDTLRGNLVGDKQMKELLDYGEGWCWDDDNPMLIPLTVGRKDIFLKTFQRELQRQGIVMDGVQLTDGITPAAAREVSTYRNSIGQILKKMMKDSDNFYAESMFYQTAAATCGRRPATAQDGRNATKRLLTRLGVGASHYRIADGSGLSLYNYLSADLLVRLLRHAWSKEDIITHLMPALPVAGVDGTLRKRMLTGAAHANVTAKTGTVTGVSALAGYLTAGNGHQFCFAILNQGIMKAQTGRDFQDRVCQTLCKSWQKEEQQSTAESPSIGLQP